MIQKQNTNINFSQGLDTKTDPKQVQLGKFLSLKNSVFNKGGLLQKRNGYKALPNLPDTNSTYATTFNGDLTAIGTNLNAFSTGLNPWVNKGAIQPVTLSTIPLIRNNTNQFQADTAIAPNGLICTVYTDQNPASLSAKVYKYAVADSLTGQNTVAPTLITGADATLGTPRVFLLGNYFIIIFTNKVTTVYHLKYIAISVVNPLNVTASMDISTSYTPSSGLAFDAAVLNEALYIAWNGGGGSGIKMAYLTSTLLLSSVVNPDPAHQATLLTVCVDADTSKIWVFYYDSGTTNGYVLAITPQLLVFLAPTLVISGLTILNLACSAQNGVISIFYEQANNYGYDSSVPSHLVIKNTVTQAGVTGTADNLLRSVGLASKSFIIEGIVYVLVTYQSPYQSGYYLTNFASKIVAKLAYSNGVGYLTAGLPEVNVNGITASFSYLLRDSITAVNKGTNLPSGTQVNGIYSQFGINLANIELGGGIVSSEIGKNLNISGGFLWGYDGYSPVEQEFFLWPDSVELSGSAMGGNLAADTYYYQVTYEWTDNQGNAFRSAPSIPVSVTTTGATSSVTVSIPTLRLTYKTANPVKLVVYRWSVTQQIYYQTTSIVTPLLNDPSVDYLNFVDTNSNATILGNNILYTTGGVIENIGPPATNITTLFDDRLWLVDAEDQNLLWYSKQVIESTPVEMSDLLTVYVAPTIASQGSTGPITALSAMDDKLIIFKGAPGFSGAIYYINGSGPDNTGLNSQYSQPIFTSSSVGCNNPASIVLIPNGIMFQSDKGIWLLGRDMSTSYIGAPVEEFNSARVQSAVSIPASNQVRFTLDNGITLMYDYYYGQWGTFVNVPAVSSTIYQGLHTYIDSFGQVFQESPGSYLDGSNPVLLSFTTSWLNLAGLQGYQRGFFFYLLGDYKTPHKLLCSVAYNYNPSPENSKLISPTNFSPTFGGEESNGQDTVFGQDTPFGGPASLENWRVFLKKQRCMALQITVQEVYDSTLGVAAGEGLNLSGINLVYGVKKGWRPISSNHSAGVS